MANCDKCHGKGKIFFSSPRAVEVTAEDGSRIKGVIEWIFCDECFGNGSVSCCQGTERQVGVADSYKEAPNYSEPWSDRMSGDGRFHDGVKYDD